MTAALRSGHTLFICGNGGSAADSEHIAGELMKSFILPRPLDDALRDKMTALFPDHGEYLAGQLQRGFRVVALTGHPALATAMANDVTADLVFAQQVVSLGRAGDLLIGITTSGNSTNVCHAVRVAQALGMQSIALTGENNGEIDGLADIVVRAPAAETFRIQEYHLPIYHFLCIDVERQFFGD